MQHWDFATEIPKQRAFMLTLLLLKIALFCKMLVLKWCSNALGQHIRSVLFTYTIVFRLKFSVPLRASGKETDILCNITPNSWLQRRIKRVNRRRVCKARFPICARVAEFLRSERVSGWNETIFPLWDRSTSEDDHVRRSHYKPLFPPTSSLPPTFPSPLSLFLPTICLSISPLDCACHSINLSNRSTRLISARLPSCM